MTQKHKVSGLIAVGP